MDNNNGSETAIEAVAQLWETIGDWRSEPESCSAFDDAVKATECFRSISEVEGQYIQPRLFTEDKTARIDRILLPTDKLMNLGWQYGPIGVELKASGLSIGHPLCQLADYSRAIFEIKKGWHIALEWVFLWPWSGCRGWAAAFCAQHRIGSAFLSRHGGLIFSKDSTRLFFHSSNTGEILIKSLTTGRKVGSR